MNGFKAAGIYPIDPYVFKDSEFIVDHQVSIEVVLDAYIPVTEGTLVAIDNSTVIPIVTEELDASSIMNQHCIENENNENQNLNENEHTSQNKVAKTNKKSAVVQDFEEYLMQICQKNCQVHLHKIIERSNIQKY